MQRSTAPVLLCLILFGSGCGSGMGRALHAFDEGRHADAVGELRALEADQDEMSERERARYFLYRGLAHFACGDLRSASRWLSHARRAADNDPSVFDVGEHGRLSAAWRSMGLMPGEEARITSGLPAVFPEHSEPPHASR
ncbi:MAG: hypothetical protein IPI67_14825 [Myxococcales bacterium]|nr:hypothetical protein [Myxococcales bacterium]